jgi:hypothetical protein
MHLDLDPDEMAEGDQKNPHYDLKMWLPEPA